MLLLALLTATLSAAPARADSGIFDTLDARALLTAAKSLPVAAPAASSADAAPVPGEAVDLLPQFPPSREGQDQGALGGCADFAVVSLFEAAYRRRFGEFRLLSVTDLFVHGTLAAPHALAQYIANGPSRRSRDSDVDEGSIVDADARYALEHGVATERDEPYRPFYDAYFGRDLPRIKRALTRAEAMRLRQELLDEMTLAPGPSRNAPPATPERAAAAVAATRPGLAREILRPELDAIIARVDAEHPAAARSREETRRSFAGFTLEGRKYPVERAAAAACLARSHDRMDFLLSELRQGRPVAVGMDVGDLWPDAPAGRQMHAFVVRGFEVRAGSRVVFKTLNTWGKDRAGEPVDHFVFGEELCRVRAVVALRTP